MNDGMGGYTCNRQLTWLFGSPASAESESESGTADEPAVEGCILTWSNPQYYYFKSGSLIAEEYSYKNASCTSVLSKMVKPAVYADDQTTANTLCKVTSGTLQVSTLTKGVSEKVWLCP